MKQKLWIAALLGAMALWFLPLQTYRLFNPDEGRYAEIPREMVASGDWVTPRLDGLKYFEKPPLQYWATAVAYELFGEHEWTARLWIALSGFLGLLLTAWIGARLYGAATGMLAALVQAGSLLYLGLARISTLDMGLTVTLELALAGLLLLTAPSASRGDERRGAWLLALGVALAFLSKGLVGILIPAAVAGIYMLLRREWSLLWRSRPWWTLAALALFAAPWLWLVEQRNPGFAQFFFVHEQFTRFLTRVHQRYQPDWFFIPVLLAGFMPWTPLLPAIVRRSWRDLRTGDRGTLLLALWAAFCFVFFSLSQSKLVPYILPLFPALSLLAARALGSLERARLRLALAISALVWLALGALALCLWCCPGVAARLAVPAEPAIGAIAGGLLLAGLVTATAAWQAVRRGALPAAALAALGVAALLGVLLPAAGELARQREPQELVAAASGHLRATTAFYCVDDYEQSIPFYLRRTCTLVGYRGELDFGLAQEPWRWIPDLGEFAARWRADADALALIRPESYARLQQMGLPMRVIYTGHSLVAVVRQ
ncbi:MAG: glycosyltransferase family 39 protein [Gammaproteobacteria bacterium]|nr:glycosyltransferase family 39 protein [Gammaproteobacteria bacterium]